MKRVINFYIFVPISLKAPLYEFQTTSLIVNILSSLQPANLIPAYLSYTSHVSQASLPSILLVPGSEALNRHSLCGLFGHHSLHISGKFYPIRFQDLKTQRAHSQDIPSDESRSTNQCILASFVSCFLPISFSPTWYSSRANMAVGTRHLLRVAFTRALNAHVE